MTTLTFYSYKGGTGRSLALANAARYLARLGFRVVALDFDLEAPGLHYKFLKTAEDSPLPVECGVADYIYRCLVQRQRPSSMKDFIVDVDVPGQDKPLIQLIPAGKAPSREYWRTISQINWHELFYSPTGAGVPMFLDLKSRIADELDPDFLLIDSRTGITEMGGVATTLLADKVLCLILPTLENLEGARAVLRSVRRSRREFGAGELEVLVALSRLPETNDDAERDVVKYILDVLNEPAEDSSDTLHCENILILHSELRLQLRESLRVGGNISPDESVLLRDYLRLFSRIVPRELVEPKIGQLVEQAKAKIWDDPEGATKEIEELAESFGRPEVYRELLKFYGVRNVSGRRLLRRAERLWDLARDSSDPILWEVLNANFEVEEPWQRRKGEWRPDLGFVEEVWRHAGRRDSEFGFKLANVWSGEGQVSRAADVALEIMKVSEPTANLAARCISWLDAANRRTEADKLIRALNSTLGSEQAFIEAWVDHALGSKASLSELLASTETMDILKRASPASATRVLLKSGATTEASKLADVALRQVLNDPSRDGLFRVAGVFDELGRLREFEEAVKERGLPAGVIEEVRDRRRIRGRSVRAPS